ncbi:MAG: cytochrome b N-terminal domain-containing protein [bacterium]
MEASKDSPVESTGILHHLTFHIQEYLDPQPITWPAFLGWINLHLFSIQGITGLLLVLYYCPTVTEAYRSVQQITNTLHYGWLIRGIHIWAVHLLIISLLLHIFSILIHQRYHLNPKVTWVLGGLMMALIGLEGMTGFLLPWTQDSYWSTTFVTQIPSVIPLFGGFIKNLARGGSEITQLTLSRFFALHILIIPFLFVIFWRSHILAMKKPLIPRDLLSHSLAILALLAVLFSLSTLFPPRIYPRADPFNSIITVKPAWYFLASYETFQLLNSLPVGGFNIRAALGICLQCGLYLLFLFLPFILPSRKRGWSIILALSGAVIFLSLTWLGYS